MDGCRRTVQGDGGGALFVVDVEQDEAKQDGQHPGKDKAGAVVGHIPQVALPESAGTTHQHSLTRSPNTAMKSACKHTRGTIWCDLTGHMDRAQEEVRGAHFQKMSLNWERAFCAYLVSKCSGSWPGGGMLSSSIRASFCLQQRSNSLQATASNYGIPPSLALSV
jgi:hypothetical protein